MRFAKKTTLILLATTAIFFYPFLSGKDPKFFGVSVAAAQELPPAPNTQEGAHWLSAIDYYNQAQAAIGRMQLHPKGTWQYDSAKKNYDHYVMRYIQFAARAGVTVTADTHPSSVFNSAQVDSSGASSTQIEPLQNSSRTESVPPAPNTREGAHWLSAIDYYNQAQAAIGRMQLHPKGTWQYDSAKKNYDHYVMRYIQFAARAGATVTAETHPSSVFNSVQVDGSGASSTPSAAEQNSSTGGEKTTTNNPVAGSSGTGAITTPEDRNNSEPASNNVGSYGEENASDDRTILVNDTNALTSAIARASCGETIVLLPGSYTQNIEVKGDCKGKKPLIVKAESSLAAIVSAALTINGHNIKVQGIYFLGRNARVVVNGEENKIIGNKFEGWASSVALMLGRGRMAEVAYNEFTKPDPYTGTTSSYPLRIGIRSSHREAEFHYSAHLHHNYFHDFPAKPNPSNYHSGQNDAIEVCYTGSQIKSNWRIEYNLIENHRQGHGVLDVKCAGGTTVQFNTLLNSPNSRIDLRNGDGSRMVANWIENAGGIAVHGDRHYVAGNVLLGSGGPSLSLTTGNVNSNSRLAETQSANFNTLHCNRATHNIGVYNLEFPARNNEVNGPIGQVNLRKETNTRINMNANCEQVPVARRLSFDEVGPLGLSKRE